VLTEKAGCSPAAGAGPAYSKDQEFCGIDGERLQELATDPMIGGRSIATRFEEAIGEGGMARVYRARHTFLETTLSR